MTVKNLSASVQAYLQNQARTSKRPFQELLQYVAMECTAPGPRCHRSVG